MKLRIAIVVAGAMGVVFASSAAPTLLLNGDFEQPIQPPNSFLPVGSIIPGWTVIGSGGVSVHQVNTGTPYWLGNTTQFMDLTGNTGGAGVISDAFGTSIGVIYQVSIDAFNGSLVSPGTAYTGPVLSIQASGSPIANYDGTTDLPAGTPVVLTYTFTAAAASTTLTFLDTSGTDSNGGWIDNVRMEVIPEPGTITIFGAFLALFGVRTLRNFRRNGIA